GRQREEGGWPRARGVWLAGGGIAGLAAATALHQRGFDAELIERNQDWGAVGAGIAVQPNGMRVLRKLGIGGAVEQAGAIVRHWLFRGQQGGLLCGIDLEAVVGDVGPVIGVERAKLTRCYPAPPCTAVLRPPSRRCAKRASALPSDSATVAPARTTSSSAPTVFPRPCAGSRSAPLGQSTAAKWHGAAWRR